MILRARASVVGQREGQRRHREKRQLRTDAHFMKTCGCNAHDAMMKCNKQLINSATITKTWKASEASVSGCHKNVARQRPVCTTPTENNKFIGKLNRPSKNTEIPQLGEAEHHIVHRPRNEPANTNEATSPATCRQNGRRAGQQGAKAARAHAPEPGPTRPSAHPAGRPSA